MSEATPSKLNELRNRSERFAAVHNALFPSEHCIVEFRDHSAATLIKSEPIGPSYAEVIAVQEAFRASVRAEQEDA